MLSSKREERTQFFRRRARALPTTAADAVPDGNKSGEIASM